MGPRRRVGLCRQRSLHSTGLFGFELDKVFFEKRYSSSDCQGGENANSATTPLQSRLGIFIKRGAAPGMKNSSETLAVSGSREGGTSVSYERFPLWSKR